MVKLELFGIRNFWVANVIGLAIPFGLFGIFFPMTVFLQGALGMTPLEAGLTMMPMSLMLMFVAPVSGRLSDRIGARWILTTGITLVTVGILFITSRVSATTNWRTLSSAGNHRHRHGDDLCPDDGCGNVAGPPAHLRQRLRHPQHLPQYRPAFGSPCWARCCNRG